MGKITNEKIGEFIGNLADDIKREIDFCLRVAKSNMERAEKELTDTFTNEQKELYKQYQLASLEYQDTLVEIYKFTKK